MWATSISRPAILLSSLACEVSFQREWWVEIDGCSLGGPGRHVTPEPFRPQLRINLTRLRRSARAISVARASALDPHFVVRDGPMLALDVSIRAQTLNLWQDLRIETELTCLPIAYQLNVAGRIYDRVAVTCVGKLVETAEMEMYQRLTHFYTKALMPAVSGPDPNSAHGVALAS